MISYHISSNIAKIHCFKTSYTINIKALPSPNENRPPPTPPAPAPMHLRAGPAGDTPLRGRPHATPGTDRRLPTCRRELRLHALLLTGQGAHQQCRPRHSGSRSHTGWRALPGIPPVQRSRRVPPCPEGCGVRHPRHCQQP